MAERSEVWYENARDNAQSEIAEIAASIGNSSTTTIGRAFAAWSLMAIEPSLGLEEAFVATDTVREGPGDGGIDGWWTSPSGDQTVILQSKYSSKSDGYLNPGDVRDFVSSYNVVRHNSSSSLGALMSDAKSAIEKTISQQGTVRVVLTAWMKISENTREQAKGLTRLLGDGQELELWGIDELLEAWTSEAEESDLASNSYVFSTTTPWVDMPGELPAGVKSAGIISVSAASLAEQLHPVKQFAIHRNVRHHLGNRVSVNRHILATLRDEPEKFWLLNNGLTVFADALERNQLDSVIRLTNPQIVNGGQTLFSIMHSRNYLRENDASVIARIVELENSGADPKVVEIAAEISESTNRQNKITSADLRSNDPVQIQIQENLKLIKPKPWYYERRRNSRISLGKAEKDDFQGLITKDQLGQHWRAFAGEPAYAIKYKSKMYEDVASGDAIYEAIFDGNRDPYEYVLAHVVFKDFLVRLPDLSMAEVLKRAQNLWAAHCAALFKSIMIDENSIGSRELYALNMAGLLDEVYEAIEGIGEGWLASKFSESEALQVKNVLESRDSFETWRSTHQAFARTTRFDQIISRIPRQ